MPAPPSHHLADGTPYLTPIVASLPDSSTASFTGRRRTSRCAKPQSDLVGQLPRAYKGFDVDDAAQRQRRVEGDGEIHTSSANE